MAKTDLGLKRQCVACGTRFYDLMRAPAVCPKCGTEQPAELPRARRPGGSSVVEPKVRKPVPAAEPALEDAEIESTAEAEDEDEEVLEDTSDLEDGDADLASDIPVDEGGDEER